VTEPTRAEARRTATVTVVFCDLVGSTERQSRLGDDAADHFRQAYFSALAEAVTATRGEVVKNTGDGLMVVFRDSAVDAVTCASKMHDRVEALDVDEPAFVRIGVSAGEAANDDGDWFGTPVVEAARLCAAAVAGQTLVSEVVRALVGSRGGHQFRSVGSLTLKGLTEPLPAAAVIRTPIAAPATSHRRPRHRRWVVPSAIALAVAALAAVLFAVTRPATRPVAAVAPVGYTPTFTTTSCSAALLAEVPKGVCGDLNVPEDRTRPNGRWLHLHVTRAPARTTAAAADVSVSINSQFPDNPATSPGRDHSDLLSIATRLDWAPDPAMTCPEFEPVASQLLTLPPNTRALDAPATTALRACAARLERSGVNLARYTVADAANDIVDLTRALHLARVNLVAADEVTPIALAVVRAQPALVRTLTLEDPYPVGAGSADPTAQFAAVFDAYAALCKANAGCARAYPDVAALERQDWAKANADPQLVTATDPVTGVRHAILMNGDRVAQSLASGLGFPATDAVLAAGMAKPPLDVVAAGALHWDDFLYEKDFPFASVLSEQCSDVLPTVALTHTVSAQARPELGGIDETYRLQVACGAWPVPKLAVSPTQGVGSQIPTLLVEDALDVQASPQAASALAADLSDVNVLSLATIGPGALSNGSRPCLNALRRTLLAVPTEQLATAGCARLSPPINFVTPPS
jgi:class 3 adenylate cyclase/pimeloyl-ACP methyl ester carboxylesterase